MIGKKPRISFVCFFYFDGLIIVIIIIFLISYTPFPYSFHRSMSIFICHVRIPSSIPPPCRPSTFLNHSVSPLHPFSSSLSSSIFLHHMFIFYSSSTPSSSFFCCPPLGFVLLTSTESPKDVYIKFQYI